MIAKAQGGARTDGWRECPTEEAAAVLALPSSQVDRPWALGLHQATPLDFHDMLEGRG